MLRNQSMWKKVVLIFMLSIIFCCAAPNAADYYDVMPSDGFSYQPSHFYDYDYDSQLGTDAKSTMISHSTVHETTHRPLVRAWNNLVRSVRRNMPNITWNVKNPLNNLSNEGSSHELQPINTNLNLATNPDRNKKKKRKNSNGATKRTNKKPTHRQQQNTHNLVDIPEQPQEDEPTQSEEDMFFLDPKTNEFYVVKRVSSKNSLKPNRVQLTPTESTTIKESDAELTLEEELTKPEEDLEVEEITDNISDDLPIEPEKKHEPLIADRDNMESLRNNIGSIVREDQLSKRRQQVAYQMRGKLPKKRQRSRGVLYVFRGW